MNKKAMSPERRRKAILSVTLAVICVIYVLPVLAVANMKMARPAPKPR